MSIQIRLSSSAFRGAACNIGRIRENFVYVDKALISRPNIAVDSRGNRYRRFQDHRFSNLTAHSFVQKLVTFFASIDCTCVNVRNSDIHFSSS